VETHCQRKTLCAWNISGCLRSTIRSRTWHDGVSLHKPPQRRVVPPRAIVVQADCTLFPLAGEMIRRRRRAVGVAARAVGLVANFTGARAAAVGGDDDAPQGSMAAKSKPSGRW